MFLDDLGWEHTSPECSERATTLLLRLSGGTGRQRSSQTYWFLRTTYGTGKPHTRARPLQTSKGEQEKRGSHPSVTRRTHTRGRGGPTPTLPPRTNKACFYATFYFYNWGNFRTPPNMALDFREWLPGSLGLGNVGGPAILLWNCSTRRL